MSKIPEVILRDKEPRLEYLLRVAITHLKENVADYTESIIYDKAECDSWCLAEDLQIELEELQTKRGVSPDQYE